eukprot:ANDGO_04863.mRNA.1 hypothetical protein SPRG_02190
MSEQGGDGDRVSRPGTSAVDVPDSSHLNQDGSVPEPSPFTPFVIPSNASNTSSSSASSRSSSRRSSSSANVSRFLRESTPEPFSEDVVIVENAHSSRRQSASRPVNSPPLTMPPSSSASPGPAFASIAADGRPRSAASSSDSVPRDSSFLDAAPQSHRFSKDDEEVAIIYQDQDAEKSVRSAEGQAEAQQIDDRRFEDQSAAGREIRENTSDVTGGADYESHFFQPGEIASVAAAMQQDSNADNQQAAHAHVDEVGEVDIDAPLLRKRKIAQEREHEYRKSYSRIENLNTEKYLSWFEQDDGDAQKDVVAVGVLEPDVVDEQDVMLEELRIFNEAALAEADSLRRSERGAREQDAKEAAWSHRESIVASSVKKDVDFDEREMTRRETLQKEFQRLEDELTNFVSSSDAVLQTDYGHVNAEEDTKIDGTENRVWKVDSMHTPQPIQIRLVTLRAVKDKLPRGKYVMLVSLYTRLGGVPLRYSKLDATSGDLVQSSDEEADRHGDLETGDGDDSENEGHRAAASRLRSGRKGFFRWNGASNSVWHGGRFFDVNMQFHESVFLVTPSDADIQPQTVLVFELFLLRSGRRRPKDRVVAWGAFPAINGRFHVIEGRFKLPMILGEYDPSIQQFARLEKIYRDNVDMWIGNLYFEAYRLNKYLPGQNEYEVELLFRPDYVRDMKLVAEDDGVYKTPKEDPEYVPSDDEDLERAIRESEDAATVFTLKEQNLRNSGFFAKWRRKKELQLASGVSSLQSGAVDATVAADEASDTTKPKSRRVTILSPSGAPSVQPRGDFAPQDEVMEEPADTAALLQPQLEADNLQPASADASPSTESSSSETEHAQEGAALLPGAASGSARHRRTSITAKPSASTHNRATLGRGATVSSLRILTDDDVNTKAAPVARPKSAKPQRVTIQEEGKPLITPGGPELSSDMESPSTGVSAGLPADTSAPHTPRTPGSVGTPRSPGDAATPRTRVRKRALASSSNSLGFAQTQLIIAEEMARAGGLEDRAQRTTNMKLAREQSRSKLVREQSKAQMSREQSMSKFSKEQNLGRLPVDQDVAHPLLFNRQEELVQQGLSGDTPSRSKTTIPALDFSSSNISPSSLHRRQPSGVANGSKKRASSPFGGRLASQSGEMKSPSKRKGSLGNRNQRPAPISTSFGSVQDVENEDDEVEDEGGSDTEDDADDSDTPAHKRRDPRTASRSPIFSSAAFRRSDVQDAPVYDSGAGMGLARTPKRSPVVVAPPFLGRDDSAKSMGTAGGGQSFRPEELVFGEDAVRAAFPPESGTLSARGALPATSAISQGSSTTGLKRFVPKVTLDMYKMSVAPLERAWNKSTIASEKFQYIRRAIVSDLGLDNPRSLEFWGMVFLLLLMLWIRLFPHYFGTWLYLQAFRTPVETTIWTPYTVIFEYRGEFFTPGFEVGSLCSGTLFNMVLFCVFMFLSWFCQFLLGSFPDIGSRLLFAFGISVFFDPVLIVIVDNAAQEYDYGESFRLYRYYNQVEANGMVGSFLTAFLYSQMMFATCFLLYHYSLRLHMNGRMMDVYYRIHGEEDKFFVPHDMEISMNMFSNILRKAKHWRGQSGALRKTAVRIYEEFAPHPFLERLHDVLTLDWPKGYFSRVRLPDVRHLQISQEIKTYARRTFPSFTRAEYHNSLSQDDYRKILISYFSRPVLYPDRKIRRPAHWLSATEVENARRRHLNDHADRQLALETPFRRFMERCKTIWKTLTRKRRKQRRVVGEYEQQQNVDEETTSNVSSRPEMTADNILFQIDHESVLAEALFFEMDEGQREAMMDDLKTYRFTRCAPPSPPIYWQSRGAFSSRSRKDSVRSVSDSRVLRTLRAAHIVIFTWAFGGHRELFRHFVRGPDGVLCEVFEMDREERRKALLGHSPEEVDYWIGVSPQKLPAILESNAEVDDASTLAGSLIRG